MFEEKKCACCGEPFACYAPTKWKYRFSKDFFCSWTCIQEFRRKKRHGNDESHVEKHELRPVAKEESHE